MVCNLIQLSSQYLKKKHCHANALIAILVFKCMSLHCYYKNHFTTHTFHYDKNVHRSCYVIGDRNAHSRLLRIWRVILLLSPSCFCYSVALQIIIHPSIDTGALIDSGWEACLQIISDLDLCSRLWSINVFWLELALLQTLEEGECFNPVHFVVVVFWGFWDGLLKYISVLTVTVLLSPAQ